MFSCPLDHLSESELQRTVLAWLRSHSPPSVTLEVAEQAYNLAQPRYVFLKSLPPGSGVLDLGAGEGSLSHYRSWPLLDRSDLRLFALALEKGRHFDNYERYELKDFEADSNVLVGAPLDAVVCAHFIEHMSTPDRAISFLGSRLRPGARVYLEWPHDVSTRMPPRSMLSDLGYSVSTVRFDDDQSHVEAWEIEAVCKLMSQFGFQIEAAGRVYLPYISDQLRNIGVDTKNETLLTLAIWSFVGWAQYGVFRKS